MAGNLVAESETDTTPADAASRVMGAGMTRERQPQDGPWEQYSAAAWPAPQGCSETAFFGATVIPRRCNPVDGTEQQENSQKGQALGSEVSPLVSAGVLWALGATETKDKSQGRGLPRIWCVRAPVILEGIQDELQSQRAIESLPNGKLRPGQEGRVLGRQWVGKPKSARRGRTSMNYETR